MRRRPPRETRVSLPRVAVVLALVGGLGWSGAQAVTSVVGRPPVPQPPVFAAYVDATVTPAYPFETPAGPAQSSVVLAFVVPSEQDPCEPSWGGYYDLDEAADALQLERRLAQLRLTGGDATVSFGGQRGPEPAAVCTDVARLADLYDEVVQRYDLRRIDLDVEGASLADGEAAARRAEAVREVLDRASADDRELDVWVTLPVTTDGLTQDGSSVVRAMIAAGVDVGVNAMTMNLGVPTAQRPMAETVVEAATSVHGQLRELHRQAGAPLREHEAWARVGVTPMIGQNDLTDEWFTIDDAVSVNAFAKEVGLGLVSMWSLNRDTTCAPPLPAVLPVVQTGCSGVQQSGARFADVLADGLGRTAVPTGTSSPTAEESPAVAPEPRGITDDPATSPFPVWDPVGTYPGGTKVVWQRQVYQARYWTSGFAPDTPVATAADSPWTLVGPVLPGDRPAPLPTLPEGSYPQWDAEVAYPEGSRVQLGLVPYEAKWWTQGQEPGAAVPGGSPWVLVFPG